MAFLTDAELLDFVQASLKKEDLESGSYWEALAARGNRRAKGSISRALSSRGYSASQVAQWDDLQEFNENIGLYWTLVYGGVTANYDPTFIEMLKACIEDLATCVILIDGEIATPENGGRASWGSMATDDDTFTMEFAP